MGPADIIAEYVSVRMIAIDVRIERDLGQTETTN